MSIFILSQDSLNNNFKVTLYPTENPYVAPFTHFASVHTEKLVRNIVIREFENGGTIPVTYNIIKHDTNETVCIYTTNTDPVEVTVYYY